MQPESDEVVRVFITTIACTLWMTLGRLPPAVVVVFPRFQHGFLRWLHRVPSRQRLANPQKAYFSNSGDPLVRSQPGRGVFPLPRVDGGAG